MSDFLIVNVQLFVVGFTFGLSGPCLMLCTPLLVVYLSGRQESTGQTLVSLILFLVGRIVSYCVLGYMAGLSAKYLNSLTNPTVSAYFRLAGAAVVILLGVLIFFDRWINKRCAAAGGTKHISRSSLFLLGVLLGSSPCPPLLALLSEILLISRTPYQGAAYAFTFGVGTFIAGLLTMGTLGGVLSWLPRKIFTTNERKRRIYRRVCGLFIIVFGIYML